MTPVQPHDHGAAKPALERVRWGIVSTGSIAATVTSDLQAMNDGVAVAVASRNVDRARDFAARHGIERAYGSYAELLADVDVDVVYVATPHRQHHAITRAALLAGKPALVEKAFTVTVAGAEDLLELARHEGLFLMEAMWTRFIPLVDHLRGIVADGAIGDVRAVRADLGSRNELDAAHRFWDLGQGGGALLDMGVYPVAFAQMLLGEPTRVQVSGTVATTGVDAEIALLTEHVGGAHALLESSLTTDLPGSASVIGTRGRIDLLPRFHHPPRLLIQRHGHDDQTVDAAGELSTVGRGYTHELAEVHSCLRAGQVQSARMPWADTLATMRTMETALRTLGIHHSEDADAMGAVGPTVPAALRNGK